MTGKMRFLREVFRSSSGNIHTLSEGNKVEDIITMLRKQPDLINQPNTSGLTALHIACNEGHIGLVETLIAHGADVNKRDNSGWTPLHSCCATSKNTNTLAICKLLLVNGKAQAEVLTNSGTTPLHYIVREESADLVLFEEVVRLLIEGGNYVDSQTKFGETPLHQAAQRGCLSSVRVLISVGANCNARTKEGETPLHIAVRSKHLEVVKLLLTHGANPKSASTNGDCFTYCERWSLHEIQSFLVENDKEININNNINNNNNNIEENNDEEEEKQEKNEEEEGENNSENILIIPKKRETFSIDTNLVAKIEKLGFDAPVIISALYNLYKKSMPVNDEKILLGELATSNNVNTECKVCLDNSVNSVLLPCRHSCLCVECAELCKNSGCPVCREAITNVIPIFLS